MVRMAKLLFDSSVKIPSTRKGMHALALSKFKSFGEVLVCHSVPRSKFDIGERIYGRMKAMHEYINRVQYIDDAIPILKNSQICGRRYTDEQIDTMPVSTILSLASVYAAQAYRSACIRIGIGLWKSLIKVEDMRTGEVLHGLYGDLERSVLMTSFYTSIETPTQIASRLGGKKRVYRPRITGMGQVTVMEDHNVAAMTVDGINLSATAFML